MFYSPKTKNEDQEYSLEIWNLLVHGELKSATVRTWRVYKIFIPVRYDSVWQVLKKATCLQEGNDNCL